MNTFKKKSLYLAVAGVSALGAGSASAVTLNADGLGQVLLYPYYTVRESSAGNAYNSLLSVVNSTASAKAVKVRFLEGKNSREVLDFNLYLSHHDVWVAAVIPTANGAGIMTPDNSCTDPAVSQDENNPNEFVNFAYVGSADDPANDDLDRTREGYVEIIEMGAMYGYGEFVATHVNGTPRNCGYLRTTFSGSPLTNHAQAYTTLPSGGLFGSMTLVNVGEGTDFSYDPVALSQFSEDELWFPPGDVRPRLSDASPVSIVIDASDQNAAAYLTTWGAVPTVDPVSAVLMHDNVYNEFVLDKATASKTDWIVTMPTKTYYYSGVSDKELKVTKLFQRNFKSTGACDDVSIIRYDREERTVKTPGSFSPPAPTVKDSLCWEANVITFNGGNVFGSKNVANITTTFENGWMSINFPLVQSSVGPIPYSAAAHQLGGSLTTRIDLFSAGTSFQTSATYYGLPVIGFAAWTFSNGNVGGVLSNYGGTYIHKYTRDVCATSGPGCITTLAQ
jgi:hypothetical protein